MEGVEKFTTNASTRLIILDEKNLGLPNPTWVHLSAFLPHFWGCRCLEVAFCFGGHGVWDIVDVLAVHRVNALRVMTNGIYQSIEVVSHGGG